MGPLFALETECSFKIVQVWRQAKAVGQLLVFHVGPIDGENHFHFAIDCAQACSTQRGITFVHDSIDFIHNLIGGLTGDDAVIQSHRFEIEPLLQPAQHQQAKQDQPCCENSQKIVTAAACHANGSDDKDGGCCCQAAHAALIAQDSACADESNARNNLCSDACPLTLKSRGKLDREDCEQRGAKADKHIGAQACGPMFELAFQADAAA